VKKKNELLIGVFTIILMMVLYWGINFLKGENVFSDKRFFYAVYDNVNGLTISRPVTINGFKVGQVSDIIFNSKTADLVVEVALEEDIPFSTNSILEIYDSDIMGSKSLELKIIMGAKIAENGDTLFGTIATGLTSEVSEQFGSVKVGLDQLIISFDKVLKEVKELSSTANRLLLSNEDRMSHSLQNIESVSNVIKSHSENIDNMLFNISNITDSLNSIDIVGLSDNFLTISQNLESLLLTINNAEGSVGKMIYKDSLHQNLNNLLKDMDALLVDIKKNPKNYVSISLWGDKKNDK